MSEAKKGPYTLDELESYILGKKHFDKVKVTYRCYQEDLENFLTMLEEDVTAKYLFDAFQVHDNFFDAMPDFKHFFPKEKRQELFYAAKCGRMYQAIPSKCVYLLDMAWKASNGIPNLIPKYLTQAALKSFLREDYFLGMLSLKDVICNVCTEDYNPLSIYHPKNRVGDFTEIYVQSTDMVAAVPNDIADCLDDKSISRIQVEQYGLEIDGILLRTMCNRVGAINSTYDLRELL